MSALLAWLRIVAGGILFAFAAIWAARSVWPALRDGILLARAHRRLYGVDAETGTWVGVRVSPLTPAEREAAIAAERQLGEATPGY